MTHSLAAGPMDLVLAQPRRFDLASSSGEGEHACASIVVTAGAIALGAVLGVLLAQRTSLRWRTACSLVLALAASCGCVALVAGIDAAMIVALVAPLGYLLRRSFDA